MSSTSTAGKMIRAAFRHCGLLGIGQTLNGDYLADGLDKFKLMVGGMNLAPQFAHARVTTVVAVPAGVSSRTIGPAMQINCARPYRIEIESFVRVDGHDYPLTPVTRQQYNAIGDKDLDGPWPRVCFFDGGDPTGILYLWPRGANELHLVTLAELVSITDATTSLVLPDGAEEMLGYKLATRLAPDYEVSLHSDVRSLAASLERQFKRANSEVPQLQHDDPSDDTASQLFGL